jgi:hypothetical protein
MNEDILLEKITSELIDKGYIPEDIDYDSDVGIGIFGEPFHRKMIRFTVINEDPLILEVLE